MPSIAISSPSITSINGTVSIGSGITVNGTGFGSSGPKILLFDDFGRGSEGEKFSTNANIGSWSTMNGYVFNDSALSRGKGARLIDEGGHVNNYKIFGGAYSEVFISSIAYVPAGYRFPAASELRKMPDISSLKHYWIYYGSSGYANGKGHDIFGPSWTGNGWLTVSSNEYKDQVFSQWGNTAWEWDKPVRWTQWIKGDSQNNLTNTKGYFQGINSSSQVYKNWDKSNMGGKSWFGSWYEKDGMPYAFDRLSLVGYFRSGSSWPKDNYVIDDVYLAVGPNSAARVEIGNKPDYNSCTKMAISTPTSWSSSKINVTVREGTFEPGEKGYLFVVDADNNPSSGFPVTFGGSSSSGTSSTSSSSGSDEPPIIIDSSSLTDDYNSSSTIFAFEAEEGVIKSAMVTGKDNNSSAGSYIWAPSGTGGSSQYTFKVTSAGNYIVWGRVLAPDGDSDSFFVSMDGKSDSLWDLAPASNWTWDEVNNRDGSDPVVYNLSAGTHTLIVKPRENGAKLDGIVVTKDMNTVPNALSETTSSTTTSNQVPPPPGKPYVLN